MFYIKDTSTDKHKVAVHIQTLGPGLIYGQLRPHRFQVVFRFRNLNIPHFWVFIVLVINDFHITLFFFVNIQKLTEITNYLY